MEPKVSSIRIGIVDLLGVFLPGIVWALLLITIADLLRWTHLTGDPSPLSVAAALIQRSQNISNGSSAPVYVSFVILALLAGYIIRSLGIIEFAEWITQFVHVFLREPSTLRKRGLRSLIRDQMFPYAAAHRDKEYYKQLQALVKQLDGPDFSCLGRQPFSGCRRLLRLYAPSLWEETEDREAQVRLVGALLVASVFSFWMSILKVAVCPSQWWTAFNWAIGSLLLFLLFIWGFRNRRSAEVKYVYLNALLALPLFNQPQAGVEHATLRSHDPVG